MKERSPQPAMAPCFLDEIGELSPDLQGKLLRALELKENQACRLHEDNHRGRPRRRCDQLRPGTHGTRGKLPPRPLLSLDGRSPGIATTAKAPRRHPPVSHRFFTHHRTRESPSWRQGLWPASNCIPGRGNVRELRKRVDHQPDLQRPRRKRGNLGPSRTFVSNTERETNRRIPKQNPWPMGTPRPAGKIAVPGRCGEGNHTPRPDRFGRGQSRPSPNVWESEKSTLYEKNQAFQPGIMLAKTPSSMVLSAC